MRQKSQHGGQSNRSRVTVFVILITRRQTEKACTAGLWEASALTYEPPLLTRIIYSRKRMGLIMNRPIVQTILWGSLLIPVTIKIVSLRYSIPFAVKKEKKNHS